MILPLQNRLRKQAHVAVAVLQDELVEMLYALEPGLVLHGGTAVWRCYSGNRFSEDLDFYCARTAKLESQLPGVINRRGLTLQKFKKTGNLIFCRISDGSAEVRVEINFSKTRNGSLGRYEKADGTLMDVLTLTPSELVLEKADAYSGRKFIRDIYDVYHLADYVKEDKTVCAKISTFLAPLPAPVDEKNLKAIVYSGTIPSFRQMADSLRRRFG